MEHLILKANQLMSNVQRVFGRDLHVEVTVSVKGGSRPLQGIESERMDAVSDLLAEYGVESDTSEFCMIRKTSFSYPTGFTVDFLHEPTKNSKKAELESKLERIQKELAELDAPSFKYAVDDLPY